MLKATSDRERSLGTETVLLFLRVPLSGEMRSRLRKCTSPGSDGQLGRRPKLQCAFTDELVTSSTRFRAGSAVCGCCAVAMCVFSVIAFRVRCAQQRSFEHPCTIPLQRTTTRVRVRHTHKQPHRSVSRSPRAAATARGSRTRADRQRFHEIVHVLRLILDGQNCSHV